MTGDGKRRSKADYRASPANFEQIPEYPPHSPVVRRAEPQDASLLTSIALQAKAYWGYPQEWLQRWQSELTVSPEYILRHWVFAAIQSRQIAGFYALANLQSHASLEHLWVKPEFIGRGLGRSLFEHACRQAASMELPAIEIVADPNAEGFYRRMGAVKIKDIRYQLFDTERVLPVFRFNLLSRSGEE